MGDNITIRILGHWEPGYHYENIQVLTAMKPLTRLSFQQGLQILTDRDRDLARVVGRYGPPPMWRRKPGFATLVRIILEQQVSLASAQAVFRRLQTLVVPFSAHRFRQLDQALIRNAGLTRQKTVYCYHLAEAITRKDLSLNRLSTLPDAGVREILTQVKGIGPWTADIYLLMALRRPDVWPRGDLALKTALQAVKQLPSPPSETLFAAAGDDWRPWRAVAARILWHFYLSSRR